METYLIKMGSHEFCVPFKPSLRAIYFDIISKDCLVPMKNPAVDGDLSSSGIEFPTDLDTFCGHVAVDSQSDSGTYPHGLFQACLEIVQFQCFGICDDFGKLAGFLGLVDLFRQIFVDRWVVQDAIKERLHCRSRRVRSSKSDGLSQSNIQISNIQMVRYQIKRLTWHREQC